MALPVVSAAKRNAKSNDFLIVCYVFVALCIKSAAKVIKKYETVSFMGLKFCRRR
jgi:hypothetical protein